VVQKSATFNTLKNLITKISILLQGSTLTPHIKKIYIYAASHCPVGTLHKETSSFSRLTFLSFFQPLSTLTRKGNSFCCACHLELLRGDKKGDLCIHQQPRKGDLCILHCLLPSSESHCLTLLLLRILGICHSLSLSVVHFQIRSVFCSSISICFSFDSMLKIGSTTEITHLDICGLYLYVY
jgi:hypothetical protein